MITNSSLLCLNFDYIKIYLFYLHLIIFLSFMLYQKCGDITFSSISFLSESSIPFFFFFDTNCKITELSASPIIQISLWEKHACFILLCLLSINTLYLGKLNHNSFSLFLLFLLMLRGLCW